LIASIDRSPVVVAVTAGNPRRDERQWICGDRPPSALSGYDPLS
jgi:hypothetical protein